MARFRALLDEVAAADPRAEVVEVDEWYPFDGDEDRRLRPDGVHLTDTTSHEMAPEIAQVLIELQRRLTGSDRTTVSAQG
jgi:lysophospholipase L1-like esterase